uniref:tetratricopeptide repeat protein n=1 Tax=Sulfuricurvum sp. TaxID=2025608 RepID=UPI0025DD91EC
WDYLNDYNSAKDFYEQSFEMKSRLYSHQDHPTTATSLNNLGGIWKSLGDSSKAKDFFEKSFEMRKRLYPNQDHPDIASSLNNLGSLWSALDDFSKAKDFYEKSFEMINKLYPNQDHPDIIFAMINLSTLLCQNPISRKKGVELLKQYKKIATKDTDSQKIKQLINRYEPNIGRDKSKRKKR